MQLKWSIFIALGLAVIMGLSVQLMRFEYDMMRAGMSHLIPDFAALPVKNGLQGAETTGKFESPYLVLYDPTDPVSLDIKENMEWVLHYLKKEAHFVDVSNFEGTDKPYSMIIITFESLNKISDIPNVLEYVTNGGHVFLAMRPMMDPVFQSISRKLGIIEVGDELTASGIHFTSNVFIQNRDLHVPGDVVSNSSLYVSLDPESRLLAKTDEEIPLLWDYPYKKGKFMVFNGSTLHLKGNRGLLVGAMSMLPDYFIYPIMNVKLLYIDDFPAYYSDTIDEGLYREYKMNKTTFFRNVWWPEMLQLVEAYGIRFTGALIQTYNNRVKPPFEEDEGTDQRALVLYGKELLNHGGELGIHGYNHQPLTLDPRISGYFNYNTWKSTEDMILSLQEVHRYSKIAYPDYSYRNYVPPSNVLSEEGRTAIKAALPEVNSISSLYLDDPSRRSYIQEFEIAEDGLIELPRITSGYNDDPYVRWSFLNTINSLGVFSHFIHPDDVLDRERSGEKSWEELRDEFALMIQDVGEQFPWLRMVTASEAALELQKYASSDLYFEETENGIKGYVNGFRGETYLLLRTKREIKEAIHCEVKPIDKGVNLVRVSQEKFEWTWE